MARLQHPTRPNVVVDVDDADRQLLAYYRGEGYLEVGQGEQPPAAPETAAVQPPAEGGEQAPVSNQPDGGQAADTGTELDLG